MDSTPASTLGLTELSARIAAVEQRIQRACDHAGRRRDEVTLLAVTKIFPAQAILDAYTLGLREFGENYVQEFETKAPQVRALAGARFHLIGHLQSNKSHKAAELFDVIQTVDSGKLARRLAAEGRPLEVMIEVKISDEQTKHGCEPADLPVLVDLIRSDKSLSLTGLMTMPPWSDDPESARSSFQKLRALAAAVGVPGLSMGMSHDLEVAIQEGSTMIRVGTALFGSRKPDA